MFSIFGTVLIEFCWPKSSLSCFFWVFCHGKIDLLKIFLMGTISDAVMPVSDVIRVRTGDKQLNSLLMNIERMNSLVNFFNQLGLTICNLILSRREGRPSRADDWGPR